MVGGISLIWAIPINTSSPSEKHGWRVDECMLVAVQQPSLVNLACTLPKGIHHDAHIPRENGRWYLCLKLWTLPEA